MQSNLYTAILLATFALCIFAEETTNKKVVQIDWENHWAWQTAFKPQPLPSSTTSSRDLQAAYLNCETSCLNQFGNNNNFASCQEHAGNTSAAYECMERCMLSFRTDADIVFTFATNLQCFPAPSCSRELPCSIQELCQAQSAVRGNPNLLTDNSPNNCVVTSCDALPAAPLFETNVPECSSNCFLQFPVRIAGDCDEAEEYFVEFAICTENCLRKFFTNGVIGNPLPQCLTPTSYTCSVEEFCLAFSATNGIDQFSLFTECGQTCSMNCIEYIEVQNALIAAAGGAGGGKRDNILDSNVIFVIHIAVTLVAFFIATN